MNIGITLGIFVASALITWVAGIWLTRTTDAIDSKFKLGSAFGGLLILGVATSLPEIAIAVTAALQGHYAIIIGTLIGGVAIQTALIAILDLRMKRPVALTFAAASLSLVLEAAFVVLVTVTALLAIRTPAIIPHTPFSIGAILILVFWLVGLWLVYKSRTSLPWKAEAVKAIPGREYAERRLVVNYPSLKRASTPKVFIIFGIAAIATLAAGVSLEVTGNDLANILHINGGLFAATFIAFTGALPNISTGLGSINLGDYKLAMSDIFGGNAFMPALFVICDIIAGDSVLRHATASDVWFAALGVLLTTIYLVGLIVRPRRSFAHMGLDSVTVLVLYVLGVIALAFSGGL
jgi:cation:H+ antiporter